MSIVRLLLLGTVVGFLLFWSASAYAFSITFREPPPGTNIAVTRDLPLATVTSNPDLATVSGIVPGILAGQGTSRAVGLLDPATSQLVDFVTLRVSQTAASAIGIEASYHSAGSSPLSPPPGGVTSMTLETGLLQNLIVLSFPLTDDGPLDLALSARGSPTWGGVNPAPEPSTLLLFGTIMVGVGLAARWLKQI